MNETWAITIAIVAGLGGLTGIAGLISAVMQRKKLKSEAEKTDADAATVISNTAVMLVEPLRKQLSEQSDKIDHLTDYVELLCNIIRDAGLPIPPMKPAVNGQHHK